MVTLKQIALEAGVSVRSVSVVLNGKATEARISPAVASSIQKIAEKMNYRPNIIARATRLKRTEQIGVLVSELANPNTGATVQAIEKNLLQRGYKMLLGLTNRNPDVAIAYLNAFAGGMVDGLLNLDPLVDSEIVEKSGLKVPYINYLRTSPGFTLRFDFSKGIWIAVEHLTQLGHKRIGFLSGPKNDISAQERLLAFRRLSKAKGGRLWPVAYGDWTFESGKQAAPELLVEGCTAIVAANDLMAAGAMKAAQAAHKKLPWELSVTGFDNSLVAMLSDPPLTSVEIPTEQVAHLSVEALTARIAGQEPVHNSVIKPSLVIRSSTGPAPRRRQ